MTEVPLKEYIESRLKEIEKATGIATANLDKRLEGMNEFRTQLKDQAQNFFTRAEHDLFAKQIETDLRMLREYKATMDGKASQQSVVIAYIMSSISIILGLISILDKFTK